MINNQFTKKTFILFQMVFQMFAASFIFAASVKLTWDANTESDLNGYKIYIGFQSKTYTNVIDVGNTTSYEMMGLESGKTYFFALTAYDFVQENALYKIAVVITINFLEFQTKGVQMMQKQSSG